MSNQSAVNVLRMQYSQMQEWLEGTMQGVTAEVAHYDPPGAASPIAGQAAHVITGMDFFLVGLAAGKQPLLMSSFDLTYGFSLLIECCAPPDAQ